MTLRDGRWFSNPVLISPLTRGVDPNAEPGHSQPDALPLRHRYSMKDKQGRREPLRGLGQVKTTGTLMASFCHYNDVMSKLGGPPKKEFS